MPPVGSRRAGIVGLWALDAVSPGVRFGFAENGTTFGVLPSLELVNPLLAQALTRFSAKAKKIKKLPFLPLGTVFCEDRYQVRSTILTAQLPVSLARTDW